MSDTNWKKVAQEAEKVRDLALEAKAAAELARVKAEQEADQAHERAANMAVELAAMTLSRDQANERAANLAAELAAVTQDRACIKAQLAAAVRAKEGGK